MRVEQITQRLANERAAALDTRDPLAIRRAGDRFKVVADALVKLDPATEIDPNTYMIGLREAAKALGLSIREARMQAHTRQLPARYVNNELRVPLSAIL
ncbi:MAG: hypothetical protein ACYC3S_13915 [Chloroflexota bacterium]